MIYLCVMIACFSFCKIQTLYAIFYFPELSEMNFSYSVRSLRHYLKQIEISTYTFNGETEALIDWIAWLGLKLTKSQTKLRKLISRYYNKFSLIPTIQLEFSSGLWLTGTKRWVVRRHLWWEMCWAKTEPSKASEPYGANAFNTISGCQLVWMNYQTIQLKLTAAWDIPNWKLI